MSNKFYKVGTFDIHQGGYAKNISVYPPENEILELSSGHIKFIHWNYSLPLMSVRN